MVTIERKILETRGYDTGGGYIRCILYLNGQSEAGRLEASFHRPSNAAISLYDSERKLVLQEKLGQLRYPEEIACYLDYAKPGTYFLEISDGFYHQAKEIRVRA